MIYNGKLGGSTECRIEGVDGPRDGARKYFSCLSELIKTVRTRAESDDIKYEKYHLAEDGYGVWINRGNKKIWVAPLHYKSMAHLVPADLYYPDNGLPGITVPQFEYMQYRWRGLRDDDIIQIKGRIQNGGKNKKIVTKNFSSNSIIINFSSFFFLSYLYRS